MSPLFHQKPPTGSENPSEFLRQHASEIGGSLCVFGDWFGRPFDNWHTLTTYEVKGDYLKLLFNEGESLEIWRPQGLKKEGKRFIIQHADRVRWEWYYYGRPQLPENRFFQEHVVKDGAIEAQSNANWYSPNFKPSLAKPAVSIQ